MLSHGLGRKSLDQGVGVVVYGPASQDVPRRGEKDFLMEVATRRYYFLGFFCYSTREYLPFASGAILPDPGLFREI